jgi:organic hydroperoxide reductase OsmC/OhrA
VTPLPHTYTVQLSAEPGGPAAVTSPGLPTLQVAAPSQYDGPGDVWSPEHLLLASVQSCLLLTFRAVARVSQVTFVAFEVDTSGIVDKQDGVVRFREIVMRARLTLPAAADRARAERVLERSKQNCLVSASLATPVRLEAEIVETPAAAPDRAA